MEKHILTQLYLYPGSLAKDIARRLYEPKSTINKFLYDLERQGKVTKEGTTPKWFLIELPDVISSPQDDSKSLPPHIVQSPKVDLIVIDLGNVHDCLENLVLTTISNEAFIMAFADQGYNGFGVNPLIKLPNAIVHKLDYPLQDSVNVNMIWTVSRWLLNKKQCRVILASKNKMINTLGTLININGHNSAVVGCWKEMEKILSTVNVN